LLSLLLKMKAVIIFALAACAFALTFQNDPFWIAYKQQFEKTYAEKEEAEHYAIFNKNMLKAAKLNEIDPLATYGWTKFSDIETHRPLIKVPENLPEITVLPEVNAPSSLDWRSKGAVTGVKDQGQCGSCWAFSTVVALEGAYFLEHSHLHSFSEKQIVDCDTSNDGCDGGWPIDALKYVQKKGIEEEQTYPYHASKGKCQYSSSKVKMNVKEVKSFTPRNEFQIMNAIQQYGPISICLDATKFDYYNKGIMNGSGCRAGAADHAVAIVGWGEEGSTKYWIVKNSWGKSWGESGYVRIQRGINACGVEDYPVGCTSK